MDKPTRSCGTCTKCCEGWLEGDAHGHVFKPGTPCYFLIQNKGCTIYSDRPEHPCKSFKCVWLADESIPDWIKPEISGTVPMIYKNNLTLIDAGNSIKPEVLEWAKNYANKNNLTLII